MVCCRNEAVLVRIFYAWFEECTFVGRVFWGVNHMGGIVIIRTYLGTWKGSLFGGAKKVGPINRAQRRAPH